MSWWASILCAMVSGVVGGVCSAIVAPLATRWRNVSTREGERAYTVIYLVLLGIFVGASLGLAIARALADRPGAGLATALAWSSASLAGIGAVALALSWIGKVPAPPAAVREVAPSAPRPTPEPTPQDPRADYARQRLAELRAFTVETPLHAWLGYSRGNDADEVKRFALRAIAARPNLTADLNELLDSDGCMAALHYLHDDGNDVSADLLPGVHAAMKQIPDLLRRSFRDPSGVRADTGLSPVRLVLAVIDKSGSQRHSFRADVLALAQTFAEAPRVRRTSRGSRFVEEKIETFDAERLLAAWLQ